MPRSRVLREAGLRAFCAVPQKANGPGTSEAVATASNWFPATVQGHYRGNQPANQVTLRRGTYHALRTLHLSLRDILKQRGMDLEGFELSPFPWQGTVLPLHHRPTNQSLLQFAQGSRHYPGFIEAEFRFGTSSGGSALPLKGGFHSDHVTSNLAIHRPISRQ